MSDKNGNPIIYPVGEPLDTKYIILDGFGVEEEKWYDIEHGWIDEEPYHTLITRIKKYPKFTKTYVLYEFIDKKGKTIRGNADANYLKVMKPDGKYTKTK